MKEHEEGVCPVCQEESLDYKEAQVVGGVVYYPWTCDSCNSQGTEDYILKFIKHTINKGDL